LVVSYFSMSRGPLNPRGYGSPLIIGPKQAGPTRVNALARLLVPKVGIKEIAFAPRMVFMMCVRTSIGYLLAATIA
jgi:hypothetical protein